MLLIGSLPSGHDPATEIPLRLTPMTRNIANKIISCKVYREQKFSDHAPLIFKYNLD